MLTEILRRVLRPGRTLSEKLLDHVDTRGGFYIECGANDGVFQSNTLALERRLDWQGILIEPSPVAYRKLLANRSAEHNRFFNCALVADPSVKSVRGDFDGSPMASVTGGRLERDSHAEVAARTLQSIVDECRVTTIDFFSLDVEGYELTVLQGLNLGKNPPRWLLVEIYARDYREIVDLLARHGYRQVANLSGYTRETHPRWDGTHNDFLFSTIPD